MNNLVSIIFGIDKHGWLPVSFHYQNFQLEFYASTVLNDPIDELFNIVTKLGNEEIRQVTWWLEPGAYLFDFKKSGKNIVLTITETEDLHNSNANKKTLLKITTNSKQIITPIRIAIEQYYSK